MSQREASAVTIRLAEAADAPALGRLGALLIRTHHEFDPARFMPASSRTEEGYASFLASQLDNPDAIVLVAQHEDGVVGYVYAGTEGPDYMALRGPAGVLHDLVVDPAHRGRGVGRALLDAALEALAAHGASLTVLWTADRNVAAQRLFARAGFRPTMVEMSRNAGPDPASPGGQNGRLSRR